MSAVHDTLNKIRAHLEKIPIISHYGDKIENATKINYEYFVLGLALIIGLCLFANLWAGFFSTVIGFVYPAFSTINLLNNDTPNKSDELLFWLKYWIIFGFFCILEKFSNYILYWTPFFYPAKVTFLLFCMLPKYNGAKQIYDYIVEPIVLSSTGSNRLNEALNQADINENAKKSN